MSLAFIFRLLVVFLTPGHSDVHFFEATSITVEQGGHVFRDTIYNYGAVWINVLRVLDILTGDIPISIGLRIFISFTDIICALLVGSIAEVIRPSTGYRASLLYAFNPGSILLSGYHGQIEAFTILPILGLVLYIVRYRARNQT